MWVRVFILLLLKQKIFVSQIFDHLHRRLLILHKFTREEAGLTLKVACLINQVMLHKPKTGPKFEVVLAIHHGSVHNASTICGVDEVCGINLVRLVIGWHKLVERGIFHTDHLTPLVSGNDLVTLWQNTQAVLSHNQDLLPHFGLHIFNILTHRESNIAWESPRSRRPSEEVGFVETLDWKLGIN